MSEKATIDELRKILSYLHRGYELPKVIYDVIFKVAKIEIEEKKKVVLIKRDPDVHKRRIQGMYVKVIEGAAMDIHPAVVGGFGADFDGDTMSVFVPLSKEAQNEAKTKMVSAVSSDSINSPNFHLTNEMLTGLYTLTSMNKNNSPKNVKNIEEIYQLHPSTVVRFNYKRKLVTTTAGRFVFNDKLPDWYEFVDNSIDKKTVNKILSKIISKSKSEYAETIDKIMKLAFESATKYPRSLSMEMFSIPPNIMKLKEKLASEKEVMKQQDIIIKMEEEMVKHLKQNVPHLYDMLASGASKGAGQIRQVMIAKGLFSDASGNILPVVARSMNEGYSPNDYFNAAGGARKGVINRVHTTAHGGYAYRKMVYALSNIEANPANRDCETRMFFKIKLTPDLFKRMPGRYVQERFGGPLIPVTEDMIGKVISLRSPVFCKSLKICSLCYGQLLSQNQSRYVGIIAAQECASLSEKIMKAFHTGGAVDIKRANILKMLMENIEDSLEPIIKKNFIQDDISLVSKSDLTIIEIVKDIFVDNNKIKKTNNFLILPVGNFDLKIENITIPLTIEQETKIYLKNAQKEETKTHIILSYPKNSNIFLLEPTTLAPEDVARRLDKYVGGKSPWTTPESLYTKFYKILSPFGDWDSVHLEVILANILRWKEDPHFPARVKYPYNPQTFSIKDLPGIMSWPLGLAFENFGKAITQGMISGLGLESSVEKIFFGEPLSGK